MPDDTYKHVLQRVVAAIASASALGNVAIHVHIFSEGASAWSQIKPEWEALLGNASQGVARISWHIDTSAFEALVVSVQAVRPASTRRLAVPSCCFVL